MRLVSWSVSWLIDRSIGRSVGDRRSDTKHKTESFECFEYLSRPLPTRPYPRPLDLIGFWLLDFEQQPAAGVYVAHGTHDIVVLRTSPIRSTLGSFDTS